MGPLLPYRDIKRGDIVVFLSPAEPGLYVVKRIMGIPGDRLHLRDGAVYRNGEKLTEPYVMHKGPLFYDPYRDNFPAVPPSDAYNVSPDWQLQMRSHIEGDDIVVPPDSYFGMGDNRDVSLDSRYWGFIPKENVIGRPMFVYWSFNTPPDQYRHTEIERARRIPAARGDSFLRRNALAPYLPVGQVKLRSKRGWILAAGAVVLALFVVRPGASRLKTRIENSVGTALQRRVEISYVHIHLLPTPGFDLDGFVVHDDPAFGAEPVLRAQEVTALLRLSSLVRGRMEISRLSLTEPSLNLVRRDDGRWNIENFLERTAQIAVAPTGKASSEPRPAFPYIEADRGRINFKFGAEKKPFAITDAKYAFWQDSENSWGMRLRGQPVRSDLNLSDTGQIKVSGSWQRAARLYDTPVQFAAEWDGGQLGQLSKFVSGADRGWRGTVNTSVELAWNSGEPAGTRRWTGRRTFIATTSPAAMRST